MQIILMVILLLFAVVVANTVNLIFPKIPLALYQIVAGLVLSLDPQFSHYTINPSIFMIAIIAPLMFKDGRNQSTRSLARNMSTLLSLAVSLSIVSVIVAGFFIHLIWGALLLPIAFMLAAIITPTDAVAVASITQNIEMPRPIDRALEHESLFNDAAGIVLFSVAYTALISGNFSVFQSAGFFALNFFGGIIVGLIAGYLVLTLRFYLTRTHTDISAIIIPVDVMTPLVLYWVAEQLNVSGILAVVAAGLVFALFQNRLQLTSTKLQIVTKTTWDIISDTLNGFVFVLLGATLPSVIENRSTRSIAILSAVALGIYLILFATRFLWIRFGLAKSVEANKHNALLIAIGGVHGSIALAMAFSISTTGNSFLTQVRGQLIFVTAAVILISLLVATVVFPLVLPKKESGVDQVELTKIFNDMIYYAENELRQANAPSKEIDRVSSILDSQAKSVSTKPDMGKYLAILDKVQAAQLSELDRMEDSGELSGNDRKTFEVILARQTELFGNHGFLSTVKMIYRRLQHRFSRKRQRQAHAKKAQVMKQHPDFKQFGTIMEHLTAFGVDYLRKMDDKDSVHEVNFVLETYNQMLRRYQNGEQMDDDLMNALFIEAFQNEHTFVQQLQASQKISKDLANELNEQISTDELVYMQSLT